VAASKTGKVSSALSQRMRNSRARLAIIVSHPIQYYVPLYKRLARRDDLAIKVFFTWHAGASPVEDRGFNQSVAWDIDLTGGYDFEFVPNTASDPGTHRFVGLRNPSLVARVNAWRPDIVHITGWAWLSHVLAMRAFFKMGKPTLFRGDSHLLNTIRSGPQWWFKRGILRHIFSWPTGFLVVGTANRRYYESFGVKPDRLFACTHSIDVGRFAEPADRYEQEARLWRHELGISDDTCVLLFCGKFEHIKKPIELMRAVKTMPNLRAVLVMVGSGELEDQLQAIAADDPVRFRIIPFQNQSRMPIVYRLADLFILPSASETWGLAVNEALACGRPVLVSDKVGCAADVIDPSCGRVFCWSEPSSLLAAIQELTDYRELAEMGRSGKRRAWYFDVARTETELVNSIQLLCAV
jgi:glycosyltransferase involved in cell wall biosynthesis